MPKPRLRDLANRDQGELYRSTPWTNQGDGGGCDRPTGGTGPVRDFAKMVASNLVGAGAASQTDSYEVGKFVTALTGGAGVLGSDVLG